MTREERLEWQRKYYHEHKEQYREYYQKNNEKIREKQRERYHKDEEYQKLRSQIYRDRMKRENPSLYKDRCAMSKLRQKLKKQGRLKTKENGDK